MMVQCQVCGKTNMDDARYCFSCGTVLYGAPPVKVEVKSPITGLPVAPSVAPIYSPRQIPRQGSCYYHPELPAMSVCSRCGRSICAGCTKPYGVLNFCPECFHGLYGKIGAGYGLYQYPTYPYSMEQFPPQQRGSLF